MSITKMEKNKIHSLYQKLENSDKKQSELKFRTMQEVAKETYRLYQNICVHQ